MELEEVAVVVTEAPPFMGLAVKVYCRQVYSQLTLVFSAFGRVRVRLPL